MSHAFVDEMMEKNEAGELRSLASQTLDMHLVEFSRGEAVYGMAAREELANPLGVIQGGVVRAARRQGASEEEIREVLRQVAVYAGFLDAWNAPATMKASLDGFEREKA